MSAKSDAACLAVLSGRDPQVLFDAKWDKCAESTWRNFLLRHELGAIFSDWDLQRMRQIKGYTPPSCFLYLARCCTFDQTSHIYKVGISNYVQGRMGDHARNPIATWDVIGTCQCASRETAMDAEASFLVCAAKAGKWCGGEWIAGCDKSESLLAIKSRTLATDRRYRVRKLIEAAKWPVNG